MLARYTMKRGVPASELPAGVRHDTRKHTRHVLRPPREIVVAYVDHPTDAAWERLAVEYRRALEERFAAERDRFDALARLARQEDVYLGCSCPTKQNPDVRRCHTWLALDFMAARYPDLVVRYPETRR